MLKKVLTLSAASVALSVPAYAGFYLNPEFNQANVGSDWGGNAIDLHIGYENTVGENGSFYLQGGPSFINPSVGDSDTKLSGKIGGGYDLSDKLNAYGEFAVVTDDVNTYGTKVGLKYSF